MEIITNDRVVLGMSNKKYQASEGISNSQIKIASVTMLDWKARYIDKVDKDRNAAHFSLGDLFHCLVLDPHTYDDRFIFVKKKDMRTNKCKELLKVAEKEDKYLIDQEELDLGKYMSDAILAHPEAGKIFINGTPEISVYSIDRRTGLKVRLRIDYLRLDRSGTGFIFDLKSARDASPEGFARQAANLKYFVQNAFYTDFSAAELNCPVGGFYFIVVEKEYPFKVGVYDLSERAVDAGRAVYRHTLDRMKTFLENEYYPGYNDDRPMTLDLPNYTYYALSEKLGMDL